MHTTESLKPCWRLTMRSIAWLIAWVVFLLGSCSPVVEMKDEFDGEALAREAQAAMDRHDYDGATAKFRMALDKFEKAKNYERCARVHICLAELHGIRSEYDQQITELEAAYQDATRDGGSPGVAVDALCYSAYYFDYLGRPVEAWDRLHTAFALLRRGGATVHWGPVRGECQQIEGRLYRSEGKYRDALAALDMAEKIWEGDPCRLSIENTRGDTELRLGNTQRAEKIYRDMDACVRRNGSRPEWTATASCGMAEVALKKGELEEALKLFTTCYDIVKSILGEDSEDAAWPYGETGKVCRRMGRLEEALEHGTRAVAIIERKNPYAAADQLENLGVTLYLLGRKEEGLARLRKSATLREEAFSADHPEAIRVRKVIADLEAGTFVE
jgi:tetratricopeptide (TPR) repeat protein